MSPNEEVQINSDNHAVNTTNIEPTLANETQTTTPLQHTTPVGGPQKKKKKITIVLIAALVLLVSLGYLTMKTATSIRSKQTSPFTASSLDQDEDRKLDSTSEIDTSNWKTATNKEYGYKYKYPVSTDKYQWTSTADAGGVDLGAGKRFTEFIFHPFLLTIAPVGSAEDDGSVFRNNIEVKKQTENEYFKLSSTKQVTKNGVNGTCWEFTAKEASSFVGKKGINCHFIKGNNSYSIDIADIRYKKGKAALDATKDLDLVAIGEAILNSFEF